MKNLKTMLRPGKISGMVCSKPPKYLIENPFDFMTEFDKWFWYMERRYFLNNPWFTPDEIPMERCGWK